MLSFFWKLVSFNNRFLVASLIYLGGGLVLIGMSPNSPNLYAAGNGCPEAACPSGTFCCGGTCVPNAYVCCGDGSSGPSSTGTCCVDCQGDPQCTEQTSFNTNNR